MTDDRGNDPSQAWIPPAPDDDVELDTTDYDRNRDDDDWEDPNPRAMPDEPPKPRVVIPIDRRPKHVAEAGEHVSEALKRVGMGGVLAELLEQAIRDPVAEDTTKTCPVCKEEVTTLFSALVGGTIKPRAECGKCQGDRNRRQGERTTELVRELKAIAQSGDPSPQREREILAQLRTYDHPDVDGLVRWCTGVRDKAERGGAKAAKTKTFADRGGGRW